MKILIVTQYFSPEPFRIGDLAHALVGRGHEVTVLTGLPNYPDGRLYQGYGWLRGPWRETLGGVRVLRVPLVSRGRSKNWRLALNYLSFAFFASLLGPLRCRGGFDLIFVFEPSPVTVGLPALVMGAIKRAPVVLWIQDLWPETLAAMGMRGAALAAGTALAGFVHQRCDALLLQSRAFEPALLRRGIPAARLRYLPNWAEDLYRERPAPGSACPLACFTGFRIVFAGNIGSAQSFDTIIEAASRLKDRADIHWIVVGDGHMRETVERQIRERGLDATMHLLGRRPPEDMPALFAAADALLVTLGPEPVFAMTIPSKIQSYLAAERPILGALDGEGAKIIRASGSGLACAAGDALALAGLAQRMAALREEERMAMGANGKAYFEAHFDRSRLLDQLEGWMRELTEQHHANTDTRR